MVETEQAAEFVGEKPVSTEPIVDPTVSGSTASVDEDDAMRFSRHFPPVDEGWIGFARWG